MASFGSVCLTGRSSNVLGNPMIGRIFPCKNTCPGRAADLATCVATGKLHPLIGNTVDVRGFVKGGPFISEVAGTEIIDQDEDHIGLLGE